MAFSAHKVPQKERVENDDTINKKAAALARKIANCKHLIIMTGAGISTSAGIADFRGPQGVWTMMAQNKPLPQPSTPTEQATPTPSHMALVELQNRGVLKYLISQNCDGLHRRSGIRPENIAELHGNSNREYCLECGKDYIRDFHAVAPDAKPLHDHRTGRKCTLCGGTLIDSIIHFGEDLPRTELDRSFKEAEKADLCLVLGSSLTVTPAMDIPQSLKFTRSAKLVICNLQETPLDHLAHLRIFCRVDDLISRVMDKLGYPIPQFILRRRLKIETQTTDGGRAQMKVTGLDLDGTPMSFLKSVRVPSRRRVVRSEPFLVQLSRGLATESELEVRLEFMRHYNESDLSILYNYSGGNDCSLYLLEFNPLSRLWKTTPE